MQVGKCAFPEQQTIIVLVKIKIVTNPKYLYVLMLYVFAYIHN